MIKAKSSEEEKRCSGVEDERQGERRLSHTELEGTSMLLAMRFAVVGNDVRNMSRTNDEHEDRVYECAVDE